MTLPGAAENNPLITLSYQSSLEGCVTFNATEGNSSFSQNVLKNAVQHSDAL